jgi:hypothetical protein
MNAPVVGLADIPEIVQQVAPVLWLRGARYLPSLRSLIMEHAKARAVVFQSLSLHDLPFETIQSQCATSFLGESCRYWIGDCTDLLKKKQDQWRLYVTQYAGPHSLMFYAPTGFIPVVPASWVIVDIPEQLTAKQSERIMDCWYNPSEAHTMRSLVANLHTHSQAQILTETLLNIHMYLRVVGKSVHDFVAVYGPHLSTYQPSLFLLSQHFFDGNAVSFYTEWAKALPLYQIPFWVMFWSEQVWRAHAFITYMHAGDRNGAYEIGKNRLPYAFTKDGWRSIKSESLRALHDQLYALDTLTKNGGDAEWIELLFVRWFQERR